MARVFGRPAGPLPGLSEKTRRASSATVEMIGLRVDLTELKQRESSFRLLFDSNPVPMIVCALDGEHVLAVNDAAVAHYGFSRDEFEKLTIKSLQAFDSDAPWAGDVTRDEQAART
jgi:PAS domain-containing protein